MVFCPEITNVSNPKKVQERDEQNALDEQENEEQPMIADLQTRQLRDGQQIKKPERLIECMLAEFDEPSNYSEAIESPNSSEWKTAMDEEMNSLLQNETWYLADLPEGRKAIGNRWVYRLKRSADGEIDRFKARLVAKGFSRRERIDYLETFSPVARLGQ